MITTATDSPIYRFFARQIEPWYLNRSAQGFSATQFGLSTDKIMPDDFDGDGKAKVAVFRHGVWHIRQTSGGINYAYFGLGNDVPTSQVQ